MDVVSALDLAYTQTATLVAGLNPAGLNAPSPWADRDVRATLNHLLGATWMFTLVNQGETATEDAGEVIGDDALLAVSAAAKENLAGWRQPGAFEADRTYFFGSFPARDAAMLNLDEVVVHNRDIAKATDQVLVSDPEIGQMIRDWHVSLQLEDLSDHGAFSTEVAPPASASVLDRLVVLAGRRP